MPGILGRYFLRFFLGRALIVTLGLAVVLLVFDVLANADDIVSGSNSIVAPLLAYAALRLPQVITLVIPLAALIATLITYATAVSSHEMVAVRAAGISIYRTTAVLLLGAFILAGAHLWFADTVLPATTSRLQLWQARDYAGMPPRQRPHRAPAWFSLGDTVVEVGWSSLDGSHLRDITVVRRDEAGRMIAYLRAEQAEYVEELWVLRNVRRVGVNGGSQSSQEELRIAIPVTPKRFAALGERPGALSLSEIWRLANTTELGGRPERVYHVWLQRTFAQPLGALVMVLLGATVGLQHARRNRMLLASSGAIGAGFLFFVAERLLLALGETGIVPSAMAVWAPAGVFSMLAGWVLLHYEG